MVKAIMHGCNGKMGQVISNLAAADSDIEIVAGIDPHDDGHNAYPVYRSIFECDIPADVIIDFAAAGAVNNLLDYAVRKNIPVVLCTTGLSAEQLDKVEEAAKKVAVLKSANMSLGINTLFKVLADVSPLLSAAGFDIEIVEKHHRLKVDAPSGTAITLVKDILKEHPEYSSWVLDEGAVGAGELPIKAKREGEVPGIHTVTYKSNVDEIQIYHSAYSRDGFAQGAVMAAEFLMGKKGVFGMEDLLKI